MILMWHDIKFRENDDVKRGIRKFIEQSYVQDLHSLTTCNEYFVRHPKANSGAKNEVIPVSE